jgi:hypothetical protein
MRDFVHSIANNRELYAVLILLNAPGWAAYSMNLSLPLAIEHSPFYIVAGVTIVTLDACVILAYAFHLVLALIDSLMDK